MKKALSIILAFVFILLAFCSCDFNAPLRKKMLEYYSDDGNYVELQGVVISPENDYGYMEIDILTESHGFPLNAETGYGEFESGLVYNLNPGDEITFISAPMYFYNGHVLPIMALEKDDVVILAFEDGKSSYLAWIEESFK